MKTWQTYSKGLIAILLLGSVSCMNKGFQVVPSPSNSKTSTDQVTSDSLPWDMSPDDQTAENAPIQGPVIEQEDAEEKKSEAPKTGSQKQESEDKNSSKGNSVKKEDSEKENSGASQKTEKPEDNPAEKSEGKPATADKSDFTGPGRLKPTIYYFPVFNEDESKCEKNTMMHASGGKDLLKVCEKTAKECGLQGSCAIVQDGVTRSFNVLGARNGQDRFFEIKEDCKFGYGVDNACLDPFYTLAADLSLYEPGQVIYVPGVVGMTLPDGSKHSGYFVIRDRGRGVTGTGRFDFFSGMVAWKDSKNPFTKMGLGDVKTNIPYYKVKGKTAQQVLRHRAFPKLPKK